MRFLRLSSLFAAILASAVVSAFEVSLDATGKAVVIKPDKPTDVIRYTLNGKDPDFSAGVYLTPIELPEGGTVKQAPWEGEHAGRRWSRPQEHRARTAHPEP
jgi:hypothetical protein